MRVLNVGVLQMQPDRGDACNNVCTIIALQAPVIICWIRYRSTIATST